MGWLCGRLAHWLGVTLLDIGSFVRNCSEGGWRFVLQRAQGIGSCPGTLCGVFYPVIVFELVKMHF